MTEESQAQRISGIDIAGMFFGAVGVIWAAIAVAALQPSYRAMFDDFGGALPGLTALFLSPVVVPALALIAPVLVGACIAARADRSFRLAAAGASIVLALLLPTLFLLSMYLPIFSMAQSLK